MFVFSIFKVKIVNNKIIKRKNFKSKIFSLDKISNLLLIYFISFSCLENNNKLIFYKADNLINFYNY